MDQPVVRSFIVRIWIEERNAGSGATLWRGHIVEVASGDRGYLKSLDDIAAFIALYFEGAAAPKRRSPRFMQWLRKR